MDKLQWCQSAFAVWLGPSLCVLASEFARVYRALQIPMCCVSHVASGVTQLCLPSLSAMLSPPRHWSSVPQCKSVAVSGCHALSLQIPVILCSRLTGPAQLQAAHGDCPSDSLLQWGKVASFLTAELDLLVPLCGTQGRPLAPCTAHFFHVKLE